VVLLRETTVQDIAHPQLRERKGRMKSNMKTQMREKLHAFFKRVLRKPQE
jgi:hypothetical protein